jgi:tRNA-dihydrouridine synthase B
MAYGSFLAPIHEYTNLPFRLLCQKYGAGATCVPLVNSAAIARDPSRIAEVDARPCERNVGVQLVGNKPDDIGHATIAMADTMPFVSWLNLNCGCPAPKTIGCGGGSALLRRPALMVKLLSAMKKHSAVPVTAKLRIKDDLAKTAAVCRQLERAGADFIIIHGRTPAQGYSGKADWKLIRMLRERIEIPLVGNGDIRTASEGRERVGKGYCDSFMVGRSAMANPMLFSDRTPDGAAGRFRLLEEYVSLHRRHLGEPELQDVKLKAFSLSSGMPGAAALRNTISRAAAVEDILALKEK